MFKNSWYVFITRIIEIIHSLNDNVQEEIVRLLNITQEVFGVFLFLFLEKDNS